MGDLSQIDNDEEWRQSPSHPRLMVSSLGQVRDTVTGRQHGGTEGGKTGKGYRQFRYHTGGSERRPYVHRLVCEAFHGPAPDGKHMVLHEGDDTSDNSVTNVRWGSNSENIREFHKHSTPKNPTPAPDLSFIHGYMSAGFSKAHIARVFGVDQRTITRALRRAGAQ